MSLFGLSLRSRRAKSAQTAKDRLQILLAHERGRGSGAPDYLPALQRDIVQAVRKYVDIEMDDVDVRMDRSKDVSSLEINVEIPAAKTARLRSKD
ncbi:cell division topological specificity factor MinE [Mameliella alba]|uniref:cell division topological specificity factor MinE n=1 Tax=Mameliella alba TaxID=561184 RepID=UPI000891B592|nr:cell division topological specificity factor MinE [Mameliella alba]MBY6119536.1 cell division topological specificity factor MinE [Mameliella alba]OWV44842.1 cell division topological specificity factor MinE [Mameliella alba]OWV50487.1 cell division topological specificity factor MinE [Mameliella alba]OWV66491.1 cell division topological specificity factor MinE [Mameliella alba]PTR42089.1 cell division topological specificity factor [Mameliella alba]